MRLATLQRVTPADLCARARYEMRSSDGWTEIAAAMRGADAKRYALKQAQRHAKKARRLYAEAAEMQRKRRAWTHRAVAMTDQMESAI